MKNQTINFKNREEFQIHLNDMLNGIGQRLFSFNKKYEIVPIKLIMTCDGHSYKIINVMVTEKNEQAVTFEMYYSDKDGKTTSHFLNTYVFRKEIDNFDLSPLTRVKLLNVFSGEGLFLCNN